MGRISKGILGGVSGTVGTVVGANWKGIDYIRSKAVSRSSNTSLSQEVQRAKFKLVAAFLNSMKDLLQFSFSDFANKMTGRNHALGYTIKNAVTGIYPDLELQYSMVLVARGSSLPNADNPAAVSTAAGKIGFSWTNNSGIGAARPEDRSILVAYCPELKQSLFTASGAARSTGSAVLNVPAFSGKLVHSWIAFISENGREVSTSIYTGQLNVQ